MPRKTKKIAVRDEFLILTNGKRTEKNYFEAVRSNYKSIFKISVKFINDDPVALVDHAIGMKNARNRVWCVFDKDEFPTDSVFAGSIVSRWGVCYNSAYHFQSF